MCRQMCCGCQSHYHCVSFKDLFKLPISKISLKGFETKYQPIKFNHHKICQEITEKSFLETGDVFQLYNQISKPRNIPPYRFLFEEIKIFPKIKWPNLLSISKIKKCLNWGSFSKLRRKKVH